jgi:sugar phosphate isomerase/epimerase
MRRLLALTALAAVTALFSAPALAGAAEGPKLGLQTWTCRNLNFEQLVEFAVKHQVKYLECYSVHFDPLGPKEETLRKKALLEKNGLTMYSFGVAQTSLDKEANRKLFEFARLMGIKLIVVEPQSVEIWDNLEELVKEYDIRLAIHNHNLNSVYGNPFTVKAILHGRDPRIGVCLDVGWVTAAGFDAAKVFAEYGDRVFDLHFKDKTTELTDGKAVPVDTLIGQGKANYPGLFAAIKKSGWSGVLAVETDSKAFAENPAPLVDGAAAVFQQAFAP